MANLGNFTLTVSVSGDKLEKEGCWLGFNGEVDVEMHGGRAAE